MKNKKYLWIIVMAVALGSAILAGCGPGGTEFTYRVAGTASEAIIKYTNADGELEETTANLPWEKNLTLGNEFSFDLTVTNQSDSGTVTCEALVDGKVLGEADSNTSVSCSGSFHKKGDSLHSAFSSAAAPSAGEHLSRGVEYAKQGQLDKAIAEFEEAIKINPDDAKAHYNLGLTYDNQGRLDEAIAEYQEAIRLDPDYARAHNNLGLAYYNQGRPDEAIAEFEEAIKINPDDAKAHNNLGIAYAEQGRADEAIAEYQEAIRLDPDYARAHNNLGLAYMEEGRAEEAIVEFETYLQLAPDAPDRAAVEEDIAKLKESAEYRNAAGGYSLLYPEGWYYTEDEAQVIFAKSEEALEAAPEEAPMVMFIAGSLSKIAESLNLEEITDPVVALKAMGENLEAEMDEVETGKLAGYPSAVTSISGTFQGASYQGDLIVALVEERVVYGVALAPPEQWEAFRSTFVAMVNSLSFFEP